MIVFLEHPRLELIETHGGRYIDVGIAFSHSRGKFFVDDSEFDFAGIDHQEELLLSVTTLCNDVDGVANLAGKVADASNYRRAVDNVKRASGDVELRANRHVAERIALLHEHLSIDVDGIAKKVFVLEVGSGWQLRSHDVERTVVEQFERLFEVDYRMHLHGARRSDLD